MFWELRPSGDIGLLSLDGDGEPTWLLDSPFHEERPAVSPNGRWLAYQSDESGQPEVYLRPLYADDERWPISTDGGGSPVWNPEGSELFFWASEGSMMAVDVDTEGTSFGYGRPAVLFTYPAAVDEVRGLGRTWDIDPVGERFLVIAEDPSAAVTSITVVLNWDEELKARVPVP